MAHEQKDIEELRNKLGQITAELAVFKKMMESKDISYIKCDELGCDQFMIWFQGQTISYGEPFLIPMKKRENTPNPDNEGYWTCEKHMRSDDKAVSFETTESYNGLSYDKEYYQDVIVKKFKSQ